MEEKQRLERNLLANQTGLNIECRSLRDSLPGRRPDRRGSRCSQPAVQLGLRPGRLRSEQTSLPNPTLLRNQAAALIKRQPARRINHFPTHGTEEYCLL